MNYPIAYSWVVHFSHKYELSYLFFKRGLLKSLVLWYNDKMLKTLHDVALGFFVNAGYGITQGGDAKANIYVLFLSV